MPELPEVEVVRRGLAEHVTGRTIAAVELRGPRVARRHLPGPDDLADRLRGRTVSGAHRRGKYLWLALVGPAGASAAPAGKVAQPVGAIAQPAGVFTGRAGAIAQPAGAATDALVLHLGMSGQLLVSDAGVPDQRHLHARLRFADDGPELRFVDQRTFGGVMLSELSDEGLPVAIGHIAADPFDPAFDQLAVVRRIKARHSAIKRVLLDQTVVSGIGNIYADEALWLARLHPERDAAELSKPAIGRILDHAREVMNAALEQGGTSFDTLYVNVNGASGYFERSLHAYGRAGQPCHRCGAAMRREVFMNRSSFTCPRCQRRR